MNEQATTDQLNAIGLFVHETLNVLSQIDGAAFVVESQGLLAICQHVASNNGDGLLFFLMNWDKTIQTLLPALESQNTDLLPTGDNGSVCLNEVKYPLAAVISHLAYHQSTRSEIANIWPLLLKTTSYHKGSTTCGTVTTTTNDRMNTTNTTEKEMDVRQTITSLSHMFQDPSMQKSLKTGLMTMFESLPPDIWGSHKEDLQLDSMINAVGANVGGMLNALASSMESGGDAQGALGDGMSKNPEFVALSSMLTGFMKNT
jgi:hypothetical protein